MSMTLTRWLDPLSSQSLYSWDELWSSHLQGVELRASLTSQLLASQTEEQATSYQSLLDGESLLRAQLLSLPSESIDVEQLHIRVKRIEEGVDEQLRNTDLDELELSLYLLNTSHELRLLKRLSAHCLQLKRPYQADLINEIFSLGEADWYDHALSYSHLSTRFQELYHQGLEREVQFLEERATQLSDADALWQLALWASELQVSISATSGAMNDDLIRRCQVTRAQLKQTLSARLVELSTKERSTLIEERAWALSHHTSDLLGRIDHTELERSITKLECVYEDLIWFKGHTPTSKADKKALKKDQPRLLAALELLYKRAQLVRAELQEKRLQLRLEGIFGHTFVRRFEQLIFVLIFVVLALLFVELLWVEEGDIQTHKALALIDTGICFVFLVEFFTKLGLARERWFYFRRRWFVDLLPSIPFMLITDYYLIDHLVSGRAVRLARISRLVRYIRILRPFIRVIRLVSFTLRGLDRLVRRYAPWLNQNLIFFEPQQDIRHRPQPSVFERSHEAYGRALNELRTRSARLELSELGLLMPIYISALERHLNWDKAPVALGLSTVDEPGRRRDIPVEQAIHALLNLQGAQLETYLGSDFPRHLYMSVGLLDVPIIRSLPFLKLIFEKRRHSAPAEFSAWIVRGVGRLLELLMTMGYWFADLYGIITGPKLIDRVGSTLVRSFERPAKRLLIIGGFLVFAHLLVSALDIPFFSPVLAILEKLFGLPVIIIGGICLIPLTLGAWMKNIAGQATELYRLTAEAQYINLIKELKEGRSSADLRLIYKRVLRPEALINTVEAPIVPPSCSEVIEGIEPCPAFIERALKVMSSRIQNDPDEGGVLGQPAVTNERDPSGLEHLWWLENKTLLLYRDYLDGALLHLSDVKTTEQLLGNLALRNLLFYKFDLTKSEQKELERLDLGSHKSIFGPFMWFSLITQSISHNTAQLLLDYNRYATPLAELERRTEETKVLRDQWRASKGFGTQDPSINLEERRPHLPHFETTDFSSLHLLTSLHQYEPMIKARYGEEVFTALITDQQRLIRGIFSSYPLHSLPRAQRTLNPYQLYQEYLFGGRVFSLPFRVVGLFFKAIALGVKWLKQKIDEIRFPELKTEPIIAQKDFVVAQRKIDRMRKPIFMKLMTLRARVDFEYLGLTFDGLPMIQERPQPLFEDDLDYIHAISLERADFKRKQTEVQGLLKELRHLLESEGLMGDALKVHLQAQYPSLVGRHREVLRALAMAYVIDFKGLQSYLQAMSKLREFFEDSLNGLPNRTFHLREQLLGLSSRAADRLVNLGSDKELKGFRLFWSELGYKERSAKEQRICWERYLKEMRDLKPILCIFGEQGALDWRAIIEEVICYTDSWSNELVTLRMIQTLTMMDVQNYRSYIWHLGDYAQDTPSEERASREADLYIKDSRP